MINGPRGFNLCPLCNYNKSAGECHVPSQLLCSISVFLPSFFFLSFTQALPCLRDPTAALMWKEINFKITHFFRDAQTKRYELSGTFQTGDLSPRTEVSGRHRLRAGQQVDELMSWFFSTPKNQKKAKKKESERHSEIWAVRLVSALTESHAFLHIFQNKRDFNEKKGEQR